MAAINGTSKEVLEILKGLGLPVHNVTGIRINIDVDEAVTADVQMFIDPELCTEEALEKIQKYEFVKIKE